MAEVVTSSLKQRPLQYTDAQLRSMSYRTSRLKPVEEGDTCCNCGRDCDGEGFATGVFTAKRVFGHPICSRGSCYQAMLNEFGGMRSECRCGLRKKRS